MEDLKRLFKYIRPFLPMFVVAFLAMVIGALFETLTRALLVPVFDRLAPGQVPGQTLFDLDSLIPRDDWYRAWMMIALLLILFTILKGVAEYASSYLMAKIGQSSVLYLRTELYDHLVKQPAVFFEKHRTNYLVSRLVVSCSAIEYAVSTNLRDVIRETVALIAFIGAAFYYNWRLTLGALIIAPVIAFLTSEFGKRLRRFAEMSLEGNKDLNDRAQETLSSHIIVKAYGAEERESKRFAEAAKKIARANLRSASISATSPPTIELIGVVAIAGMLFFGLREIDSGRMVASEFFAFLVFLLQSYDPLRKISRQHNEITKAFAAARDVWAILDEDEALPEKPDAIELRPLADKISIESLVFNYRNSNRKILRDIDLEINRGEMVALVGESGGGKSSLTRLVQRLYDPSEGSIFWDGIDLRNAQLGSLKRQIALVTQETVLFHDTIRENIAYGKPDASLEEVKKAAEIAAASGFIEELPNGYETLVGERGIMLSGGQRQRIAIARAVLLDAPVLILDEATSALDTESEALVQKALGNLMKGRTSIVIAHRLSTVRKANKIVVMEKGRIVETGTHTELLEKAGTYKRLYELQFADMEEFESV